MDLYHHPDPLFTNWVVSENLLSGPMVVIDIGVQGGAHPRWQYLGPYAEIHGFDPIAEVIEELQGDAVPAARSRYHNIALGNEDGPRPFFVSANRFGSSFFSSDAAATERVVTVRRLDSLFNEGIVPAADVIKLDCEGFEPEILKGARQYLVDSDVLSVETETNFRISPVYPRTHFHAVNEILVDHRLLVFDWNYVRAPAGEYAAALAARPWPARNPMCEDPPLVVGRPTTCNFVFCRDFAAERRNPDHFRRFGLLPRVPSADMIVKSMIFFELHGLMDCAVELAATFRDLLAPRLDVEKAVALLIAPAAHPRYTADIALCLNMIGELRGMMQEPRGRAARRQPIYKRAIASAALHAPPALRRGLRNVMGEKVSRMLMSRLLG